MCGLNERHQFESPSFALVCSSLNASKAMLGCRHSELFLLNAGTHIQKQEPTQLTLRLCECGAVCAGGGKKPSGREHNTQKNALASRIQT